MISSRNRYYLTSFIAGGCLMAMEILVAKLIGPYFGASLYVWAATIGTTLIGLATGYYYSGMLTEKQGLSKKLFFITVITGGYILVLPVFSGLVMDLLMDLEVKTGIIISTLIFNFPLFFLFGLFSPLIIELISKLDSRNAGNTAGFIYGLSTVSGVIFMLILGVYLLPNFNMYPLVYGCGVLLILTSLTYYLKSDKIEE